MPNYKQATIAGEKWTRAARVIVENPNGGTPQVMMYEEEAINLGDRVLTQPVGFLSKTFDPVADIPLVDPTTGAPTGTSVTHQELYVILHSLYMQMAGERDAAQAAQQPAP